MKLCRIVCLILFAVALGPPVFGQGGIVQTTITGSGCASIDVTGKGVVGISITNSGTAWSGTIQPEVALGGDAAQNTQVTPSTSSTAQNTITANGNYQAFVSGYSTFFLCGNTVTNIAGVKLQVVPLAAKIGGGGSSGLPSGLTFTAPTLTVSAAGSGNGQVALSGNTSGTATLTAPAVAGTASNPIASTNGINIPSGTSFSINSDTFISRYAASGIGIGSSVGSTSGFMQLAGLAANGIGLSFSHNNTVTLQSTAVLVSTNGAESGTMDTGLSRTAAGVWAMGNGTAADETGLLRWNTCKITTAVTLSTSATTICSWSLPAVAKTWSWQCSGIYSLTAGTTPTFILGMNPSQAPTSETGSASILSTLTGTSTQATVTATASGNTNILTGATNTQANAQFTTFGTIQASATAGTFAITGTMGGTTPAGTVNVGTTCQLY